MFNELRQLSQAIIQNGGTLYDVIELYSTKSMREMKKTFKNLKDRQQMLQDQQMQQQQQQLEQQQQIATAQMQAQQQQQQEMLANQNYQQELDRINKKEIALINAAARGEAATQDVDDSGTADILEISNLSMQQSKAAQDYQLKMQDIQSKNTQAMQKLQLEKEKINVARENMKNDVEVAKINATNRASKSNKK
jgi:transcription factor SPT20